MTVPINIDYFKHDQRLEFRCPFCSQKQEWNGNVRIESDDTVDPDPKTVFSRHTLGGKEDANSCLVRPSVDEVDEYEPTARINP